MSRVKSLSYFILLIFVSSCGVMFGGSTYNGTIIVEKHKQADIYVNNKLIGKGSGTASFPRSRNLVVEIEQEGCAKTTQTFGRTLRPGTTILTFVSWGLIGLAVDLASSGAFQPDHIKDYDIEKVDINNFTFYMDYPNCPESE